MQDMDLYTGKTNNFDTPQFDVQDPEYFTRISKAQTREEIKSQKKATRIISFIAALCILSFTFGLIIGLKFGKNNNTALVDSDTKKNMMKIKNSVSTLIKSEAHAEESASNKKVSDRFPEQEFPFVIKVGKAYTLKQSKELADFLSKKGVRVIISKKGGIHRIYTGPYRSNQEAEISLQKIISYNDNSLYKNASILKR